MASVDCINSIDFNTSMLAENINGDKKIKFSPNSYEAIKNFFNNSEVKEEEITSTEVASGDSFTLIGRKPLKVKEDWVLNTNNKYLLNNELESCNFIDVNNKVELDLNIDDVVVAAVPDVNEVVLPTVDNVVLPVAPDTIFTMPSVDSYLSGNTDVVMPVVPEVVEEEVSVDDSLFKVSPISNKAKIERYEEVDTASTNDSFDNILSDQMFVENDIIPVVVPEVMVPTTEVKDIVNVVPIREESEVSISDNDDNNVLELKEKLSEIKSLEEEQIRKNNEAIAQAENAKAIREKLEKDVALALAKKKEEIEEKKRLEQVALESLKKEQDTANELEALLANI